LFPRRPAELRVADPIGVLPGEQVVIGVDEAALVASALSAYLVPLLALLAGAIAASTVPGAGETGAMVGAASGFAAGLWFARSAGRRLAQHDRFQPTVLRRMAEQEKGPRIPLAV
jgi:sigma-E factor negative regulatory protein RseC